MKTQNASWKYPIYFQQKQKGVIAVVVAIGLAAILGMVGLAVDSGHMLLNKTRLQNAVDAAALSGARVLQESTSTTPLEDARNAAIATFTSNLQGELDDQAPTPTVTFSEDLTPGSFAATTPNPPNYIKVSSPPVPLTSVLIQVLGFNDKRVSAAAVAGFGYGSGVCDMIPVMVCGRPADPNDPDDVFGYKKFDPNTDFNPNDPDTGLITLKMGTADGWDPEVGNGNFHLLNLPGMNGSDDIRYALAGGGSCGAQQQDNSDAIDTKPGVSVGPVVQGINTRFGIYTAGLKSKDHLYPPDYANKDNHTCNGYDNVDYEGNGGYDTDSGSTACLDPVNYYDAYQANGWTQGAIGPVPSSYQRRVVTMPIADCGDEGDISGRSEIDTLGFGCFLLTSPAEQTGGATSNSGALTGVFIDQCFPPTEGISQNSGATTIVLFKNPDGADS